MCPRNSSSPGFLSPIYPFALQCLVVMCPPRNVVTTFNANQRLTFDPLSIRSLPHGFTNHVRLKFWDTFERVLGDEQFSHLTCVELICGTWAYPDNPCADQLYGSLQKGDFERHMPKIYNGGILWWGDSQYRRVYPISRPFTELPAHDRVSWEKLSCPSVFPLFS